MMFILSVKMKTVMMRNMRDFTLINGGAIIRLKRPQILQECLEKDSKSRFSGLRLADPQFFNP